MRDLGDITPVYGRWFWPFRVMKPGDYFTVSAAPRDPENVRKVVGVRAAQIGKRFSVNKNWEGSGLVRVMCVAIPDTLEDIMS